ncbi:OprD family porin [Pseudomonas matsuisoli]|uniref:Porin D n=1 Tax=Pseudomonas matsuisoli TaxID=1515666 RepID=A0A917PIU9_9PSED|nr:OprD family porin [Pseudomonas matsuisoli]GGJ81065.1 porin D [Pseudomonas matsuisoli]
MKVMKWSVMALAVAAGTTQLAMASAQSESNGFVEDSSLDIINRNYYFNHDGKNGGGDGRDWTHAMLVNYESGFTQGTVGFGIDAFAVVGLTLDSRFGGAGNAPYDNNGEKKDDWQRAGGAVKFRVSDTTLKYGTFQPTAPVFAVGGSRITPQMATGFGLVSEEIEDLMLEAGHFTSASGPRSVSNNESLTAAYAGIEANSADFVGGTYGLGENLSLSLYGSEFEDVWRQYYGNVNYTLPINDDQALAFDFNIYRTLDEGSADAGSINTTIFSLATAYSIGAHTFTVAYQQNSGDTPFDYVGVGNEGSTGDSIFLANSVHVSDFNGPKEKSAQVRYDIDMTTFGLPGVSFMARYLTGWNADYTRMSSSSAYFPGLDDDGNLTLGDNGKHQEFDFEARYVVQNGPAKDLSFRLRQAFHNGNDDYADTDTKQTRLMIEYPLSIL